MTEYIKIEKAAEEGQKSECAYCGIPLIARLTDYKGRYDDYLQWQSKTERKSHYLKDGGCKGQEKTDPNEIQLKSNEQSTLQSEQDLSKGELKPEIISLATLDEKINTIQVLCESFVNILTNLKTELEKQ